jgi:prefoldin subunit 5
MARPDLPLDRRVERLEEDFQAVTDTLDDIQETVHTIQLEQQRQAGRLETLESQVQTLGSQVESLGPRVDTLGSRVERNGDMLTTILQRLDNR